MTTTLEYAVTGDIKDFRTLTLGGVTDLAAASAVEAHVWRHNTHATLAASIVDATARTVRIELGDTSGWLPTIATAGDWNLEIQVTFADGTVLTWPQRPQDAKYPNTSDCILPVRSQGA